MKLIERVLQKMDSIQKKHLLKAIRDDSGIYQMHVGLHEKH